jgi:hypothetical protein
MSKVKLTAISLLLSHFNIYTVNDDDVDDAKATISLATSKMYEGKK